MKIYPLFIALTLVFGCHATTIKVYKTDSNFFVAKDAQPITQFHLANTGDTLIILVEDESGDPTKFKEVDISIDNKKIINFTKEIISQVAKVALP